VLGAAILAKLARFGLPDQDVKPAIGASTVVYDKTISGLAIQHEEGGVQIVGTVHKDYLVDGDAFTIIAPLLHAAPA
jgi:hypothetical protein